MSARSRKKKKMSAVRARDLRAIGFCLITIPMVFVVVDAVLGRLLVSVAVAAAYACFILTRPRMIRVFRRLSGERVERISYYSNE